MSNLLLGLDGGGSKTLALLAGADGSVLGRGIAGASNYQNIGEIAAWAALDAAIAAAFADAASRSRPTSQRSGWGWRAWIGPKTGRSSRAGLPSDSAARRW